MGRGDRFRRLKHRFENRRPSISRLFLGNQIEDPQEYLGASVYDSINTIPTNPANNNSTSEITTTTTVEEGAAFDSIVVEAVDGSLHHAGDDDSYSFSVAFSRWNSLRLGSSPDIDDGGGEVDDATANTTMIMKLQTTETNEAWFGIHKADDESEENIHPDATPWDQLKPLLKEGANPVTFFCLCQNTIQFARANIWLWKACDKVIISDIDGTLTKSNARGVLGTILTQNYDRVAHAGVCDLLSRLTNTCTKTIPEAQMPTTTRILYLTSRPIHLANKTRRFLSGLTQATANDIIRLPQGPLLGFGGNLAKVLSMEVLSKSSQAFKYEELERHVVGPFRIARECGNDSMASQDSCEMLFVAAFGNNLNDVQAYHKSGVNLDRIFLIDKNSKIVTFSTDENEPPLREEGFLSHSWYNDRISTVFDGYCDTKLHSLLGVSDR